jgi:hypothetical protein
VGKCGRGQGNGLHTIVRRNYCAELWRIKEWPAVMRLTGELLLVSAGPPRQSLAACSVASSHFCSGTSGTKGRSSTGLLALAKLCGPERVDGFGSLLGIADSFILAQLGRKSQLEGFGYLIFSPPGGMTW